MHTIHSELNKIDISLYSSLAFKLYMPLFMYPGLMFKGESGSYLQPFATSLLDGYGDGSHKIMVMNTLMMMMVQEII